MHKCSTALMFVATAAIALVGASVAQAYSVYNSAGVDVGVIGETCPGCFLENIKKGHNASCPGDKQGCRGDTWISWTAEAAFETLEGKKCDFKLDFKGSHLEATKKFVELPYTIAKGIIDGSVYGPMYYCPHRVPAHGWVTVKGDKGDSCHVKDPQGKVLYDGVAKVSCGPKK